MRRTAGSARVSRLSVSYDYGFSERKIEKVKFLLRVQPKFFALAFLRLNVA